jgi:hypothetical protein
MSSEASLTLRQSESWPMYFAGIAALSLCAFDIPIHGPTSLFYLIAFITMHALPFAFVFADILWFYRFTAAWLFFFLLFPFVFREEGMIFVGLAIFFLIVIYRTMLFAGFEIYQLNRPAPSPDEADRRRLRNQFTIRDLFLVTIVVGVSAGLIRLGMTAWPIGPEELFKGWTPFTSLLTAIGNIFLLHTMLNVRFAPWRMFAGTLLAVPWLALQSRTIDYWKVISFALGYTKCVFFFALLRANGYRCAWTGI